jgi:hypothetical protein
MNKFKLVLSLKKLNPLHSFLYSKGFKQINYATDYIDTAIWDYQSTLNNRIINIYANEFADEVIVSGNKEDLQFLIDDKSMHEEN